MAAIAGCGASDGPVQPPRTCAITEPNGAGPYYKPGAPARSNLVTAEIAGAPLALSGQVLDARCRPIAGARLDVWHASADGDYDMTGMRHRGVLRADERGRYALATIIPAPYPDRGRMRPRHIHVIVTAPGHAPLTTQVYFPDDEHAAGDAQWRASLVMRLAAPNRGHFDFHLTGLRS